MRLFGTTLDAATLALLANGNHERIPHWADLVKIMVGDEFEEFYNAALANLYRNKSQVSLVLHHCEFIPLSKICWYKDQEYL